MCQSVLISEIWVGETGFAENCMFSPMLATTFPFGKNRSMILDFL